MSIRVRASVSRRLRRPAALGLTPLLAAVVAVGGCGSSGSSGSSAAASAVTPGAGAAIQRAAYVSSSASGYRVAVHLIEGSPTLGGDVTGAGVGSFNLPKRAGSMALNLKLPAGLLGTLALHEVLFGQKVYLELPSALASKIPGAKPWILIDLSEIGHQAKIQNLASLAGGPGSTNPSQFLQYLRATSAHGVHRMGTAVVDGFQTTHYRATIDLAKAPAVAPRAQRAQMRQAIGTLQKMTGLHTLPVDVWVDSQHLVRRLMLAYKATLSGQSVTTAVRLDFLSYGPQPVPKTPPAGEVSNLSTLLGSSTGASAGL